LLQSPGENNGTAFSDGETDQDAPSAKPSAVTIIDGQLVDRTWPAALAVVDLPTDLVAGDVANSDLSADHSKTAGIKETATTAWNRLKSTLSAVQDQSPAPGQLLVIIWFAGFLLLGGSILAGHWRRRQDYRAALPFESDAARRLLSSLAGNSQIQLRQSDRIRSPMACGLIRPVILLPAGLDRADQDQNRLTYILAHELVHIRRGDIILKWLMALTLCLHWFNPLVWLLFILANRDIELSCDEQVVRRFGIQARSAYAMTLISMAERRSQLISCTQGFGRYAVAERIRAIMMSKKQTASHRIFSMLLVIVITLAFATSASAGASAAMGLSDLAGAESLVQTTDVFRGALGEKGSLYSDHVNSPAGEVSETILSGHTWRIENTLYTDLDVYVLLSARGADNDALPVIDGAIQTDAADGAGEPMKTLFLLTGNLRELEPDASGTRYFLYAATLAKVDQVQPANEEQANLILAAGDQWRYYTSLTDHEGAILALTIRDAGQQAELAAPVTRVRGLAVTLQLDTSLHDQHFYDTAVINPFLVRLSGTARLSQEEIKADFFWFEPDSELYIELKIGQLIFAGSWGREKRPESELETPGYRLGGGSAGGDETTGEFHLEQPFRFFELEMAEVAALIINGIRYPLS
jgi:beta-lactamase regulating signal transducer with metallopeptidase domain